ncbi:MAG TPA: peptidylprolyl isomerase [candidate division Zixibacteria bacterium]|nr:peptidylprolyl isomerase [candidate division Zixibacteria bacterium]
MNLDAITNTNVNRRRHTQRLRAVCLTVAAALALSVNSGCSSGGGKVVAVVNGDQIPLLELENQLKVARVQFFPSYEDELTIRRAIVDTLVIQQLLVQEAYKKNFDEIEEVARIALSNKEKFLLDALFEREVGDDIEAGEAEIQDHYNKLEFKYRASHILVDSREEALALIDSLENGAPFGRLAFNHSNDRKSAKDNGDIGYFIWGQMATEFQNAVVQMAPGDISSPVKTRFGWHVINLTE